MKNTAVLLVALLATAPACTNSSVDEEEETSRAALGNPPDPRLVAPRTLYLAQTDNVKYGGDDFSSVEVCRSGTSATALAELQKYGASIAHVVIARGGGKFATRGVTKVAQESSRVCQGPSFVLQLSREDDVDHLKAFDVSQVFSDTIAKGRWQCSGAVARTTKLDVTGLRVTNGVLERPDVDVRIGLDVAPGTTDVKVKCLYGFQSPVRTIMIGYVPVVVQLAARVGVDVTVDPGTRIDLGFGTSGGTLTATGPGGAKGLARISAITPQLEFTLTFYGVVGAYLNFQAPITLKPKTGCTPAATLDLAFKAGVQAPVGTKRIKLESELWRTSKPWVLAQHDCS